MSDEPETISAESPPEPKQKTVKKKKKPEKPEWNRYIWHLTDKRRDKLMELPVIPKSVKQTNKELLKKQRSRSAMSEKDSKSVIKFDTTPKEASKRKETTSKLLKSIIKNSDSTSSSRSHSRAKSYNSDEDSNRKSPMKTILKRAESRNSIENEEPSSGCSDAKLNRRKIHFRSVRGNRDNTDLRDFEAKFNSVNHGFEQMQVSPTYSKLLRSLRANLDNYNRCRYNEKKFLDEYKDVLDPPMRRIIVTARACRRNNYMNHFYDGDTMTGAPR